ncbi:HDIG domain-containing protein [Bacillus salacetis]|uniref:HDIG domain-containing protein n=1 Tax=Bacillus salacetis TaxID=2315464 RepID=A0A3A1RAT4_9BACI|nr:HD family phosphohydrolase [Bacillus salacetis]RIW37582.1 HDIG domain-containing protein [Bacillus salacetis]
MKFQPTINKIRSILSYKVFTLLIFVLLGLLLYGVLYSNVKPEKYDVNVFETSDVTIRSPKTITDGVLTEKKREEAAEEVPNQYTRQPDVVENRVSLINSIFEIIKEVKKPAAEDGQDGDSQAEGSAEEPTTEQKLDTLKAELTKNVNVRDSITQSIPDNVFKTLLTLTDEELNRVNTVVKSQVETTMSDKIYEEDLYTVYERLDTRLRALNLPSPMIDAAVALSRLAITPTEIFDKELTDEKKQEAMEKVSDEQIIEGEVIVQQGQMITHEDYRQLELLGLLSTETPIKPFIGLGIFVILAIGAIYYHFNNWDLPEERKQNRLILLSLIFVISLILMKIIALMKELDLDRVGFLFPAAMAGMLIRIMLNERIAMLMVMILAACGSIVFHYEITGSIDIEMAIYIMFSGLAGVLFLSSRKNRTNILQAGLFVSLVNVLIILFLLFLRGVSYSNMEYTYFVVYGFVSGIGAAVLTIGFLPFFEAGFGILTAMKLVELSNPNHPLLKKLLTEAPGTYHHSVMVANLAETACEAIGANGLLARVGCYYHDVGKTVRPRYFIENQMNAGNPHDHLPPDRSRDIIISHATDGAEMLRKYKLPKEFIDIAEQHHGTTLLKYFYYKALKEDEDIDEASYRYPGPKPRTKEAAVINIADSVEAAVRSMKNPNTDEIRKLVDNIVKDRLQDGQFNECDITLKELDTVKKTFCETLNGIFHSRIEYPEAKEKELAHES